MKLSLVVISLFAGIVISFPSLRKKDVCDYTSYPKSKFFLSASTPGEITVEFYCNKGKITWHYPSRGLKVHFERRGQYTACLIHHRQRSYKYWTVNNGTSSEIKPETHDDIACVKSGPDGGKVVINVKSFRMVYVDYFNYTVEGGHPIASPKSIPKPATKTKTSGDH